MFKLVFELKFELDFELVSRKALEFVLDCGSMNLLRSDKQLARTHRLVFATNSSSIETAWTHTSLRI